MFLTPSKERSGTLTGFGVLNTVEDDTPTRSPLSRPSGSVRGRLEGDLGRRQGRRRVDTPPGGKFEETRGPETPVYSSTPFHKTFGSVLRLHKAKFLYPLSLFLTTSSRYTPLVSTLGTEDRSAPPLTLQSRPSKPPVPFYRYHRSSVPDPNGQVGPPSDRPVPQESRDDPDAGKPQDLDAESCSHGSEDETQRQDWNWTEWRYPSEGTNP